MSGDSQLVHDHEDPDPMRTLVPEGEYRVICERISRQFMYGRLNWFVLFRISEEGPHFGRPLLRFYAVPRGRLARSSNLFRDYMAVKKRLPPAKGLRPDSFLLNREFVVRVVTVKTGMDGKRRVSTPEACRYSRIDGIVRSTTG